MAQDSYTVVTRQSWGQRLKGAFAGIVVVPGLMPAITAFVGKTGEVMGTQAAAGDLVAGRGLSSGLLAGRGAAQPLLPRHHPAQARQAAQKLRPAGEGGAAELAGRRAAAQPVVDGGAEAGICEVGLGGFSSRLSGRRRSRRCSS